MSVNGINSLFSRNEKVLLGVVAAPAMVHGTRLAINCAAKRWGQLESNRQSQIRKYSPLVSGALASIGFASTIATAPGYSDMDTLIKGIIGVTAGALGIHAIIRMIEHRAEGIHERVALGTRVDALPSSPRLLATPS